MPTVWLKVKGWLLTAGAAILMIASVFLYGRRNGKQRESDRRDAEEKIELVHHIEKRQAEQHSAQEIKNDVNRMSDDDVDKHGDDKWMRD